jgi:hypothetical protein
MIQNERFGTGLKDYLPYTKIVDQTKTSDQYFRLFDVPDKLYVGKNSFRIRINRDTLVKGSLLYIDIVDSNGEIIFHEITELIGEDGSRLIVVHVYEDTPPGEATIYIGGRASYDTKNQRQLAYSTDPAAGVDFIDFPNLIWKGKVVVIPTNETENELIFAKPPIVKVKERFEEYKTLTPGEKRKIDISGSFNVSINPIVTAYEYSDSSKSGNKLSENSLQVILDPIISDSTAQSRQESIPQYSEIPTLYDANGNFTEDFKGGEIIIRDLTQQLNVPGVTVPDFSSSIIEVVDVNNVKIWPAFNFLYGEKNSNVFKTIKNATNITASYYTTKTDLITSDSESFMQLEFDNLEPIAGKVDSVALSYKPYGTFGEFLPIGQFKIKPQEFLIDSSSLVISKTELIEREIGKPTGSADFDNYWELISGKYNAVAGVNEGQFANQGIIIKTTSLVDSDAPYDYKLKLKSDYGIRTVENTEFKITFTLNIPEQPGIRPDGNFQLDVFISGSSVLRDNIANKDSVDLLTDSSEGTRISSLTKKTPGAVETYTYYFKTLTAGKIYPVFVFKNPIYLNIKNISIQPRNEFGYSPNQARLFVPLETLKKNTEMILNVEYLTKKGDRSKVASQIYGLFFTGSGLTPDIVDDGLNNSPVFISVSESISVQTSGSSLYSTDPATSGFSEQYGIFLGVEAGKNANQAEASIMLGYQAGYQAADANNSNFIGQYSGYQATYAGASNFIGTSAGYQATNAGNSNFIGTFAGRNATSAFYSNFLGNEAGYQATNANDSNFIGDDAGYQATNANNSNFIGNDAGYQAVEAVYSNFIGRQSGYQALNAQDSNFIGFRSGYQATNAEYSNFIGADAGSVATNSDYSNFIGFQSGLSASNAQYSNFIGLNSGYQASRANNSNFIGVSSGFQAVSASNSILIGYNAGATLIKTRTIGSDNIVIGNGISLPVNSRYGLNIAGLIFGTGSYSTQTLDAFSGSANGRIGINQPNPKYSLDISGSGNYTNNLHVTGGLLVTQSYISTVDYIDFTKDVVTPFAEGRIHWDDDRKTLQVDTETNNFSISAGHVNVLRGRNTNSFTITKGTVVYVNGNSGQFATFATASWDNETNSAYTIGIVPQDISTNQYGYAVIQGEITGINTNGFTPGTLLYLSSSGQYTNQSPISPNHTVRLGQVVVASTSGILQVKVDNGYEIGELHNVLESNLQTGDLLIYDSGSVLYRNSKILSGSYGISGSLIISGGITGSLFGTSSYASSALSSSYAISSSFATTSSYALNSTPSFPYTGSAHITGSLSVTGSLNLTGSLILPIKIIQSGTTYTFNNFDYTVIGSVNTLTDVYLPAVTTGRICVVKNYDKTTTLRVSGSGLDTIDGDSGYSLTFKQSVTVQGSTGNWFVIANS